MTPYTYFHITLNGTHQCICVPKKNEIQDGASNILLIWYKMNTLAHETHEKLHTHSHTHTCTQFTRFTWILNILNVKWQLHERFALDGWCGIWTIIYSAIESADTYWIGFSRNFLTIIKFISWHWAQRINAAFLFSIFIKSFSAIGLVKGYEQWTRNKDWNEWKKEGYFSE